VKVIEGEISNRRLRVAEAPFFSAVQRLEHGELYRSPLGPRMVYALPVHDLDRGEFQGAVVLDFVYPVRDFQRTSSVIVWTFVIITSLSLGVALLLTVHGVRRLTEPIRRLAEGARRIAGGERHVQVSVESTDEIGHLAGAFNEMTESLKRNETALRRKGAEARTLYEVGQEIISRVDLEPTLELIVDRARSLLNAELSVIALREEEEGETDVYPIQAHSGPMSEALGKLCIKPGQGLGGRAVATGMPAIVGDYDTECPDSPFLGTVRRAGLRSVIAVPLKSRNDTIGILYVASSQAGRFGDEDLQLLSALADQAAIAIESAKLYQQVKDHAVELEAKVQERTQELEEANRQLALASRHKSEFLANMSHELRTPMNAIIGFTRLVMRRCEDTLPKKQYENLQKIAVSADHLLGLINDILDLSKVEAGRMDVHIEEFALEPLVDGCLRTVEPMIKNNNVRVVKELDTKVSRLLSDQEKLRRILINLLSNAVKFTEVGRITVTARAAAEDVVLSVADTGAGIPEEDVGRIFDEFTQADSGGTRYAGTGLGLAIVRHLTRLLGGDIKVESVVGKGSTFTLTIPRRHPAANGSPRRASKATSTGRRRAAS
nr:GAF domain-containing protein [Gammaproteobacteria bacterium]